MTGITLDSKHILNKRVITSDGFPHDYIMGQTENELIVIEGIWRPRKYMIPKSAIKDFYGNIVYLNITENEFLKCRVK